MKKQRKKKKHIFLGVLSILLVLIILATTAAVIYILPYSRATMDLSLLAPAEERKPAVLYVSDGKKGPDGETVYHPLDETLPTDLRRQVILTYEEIPQNLINAFVAIEDKRFYEHQGVDFIRTFHAAYNYVSKKGDASFGGSTITQQLVKNLTGQTDRTPDRKLTEIFTAIDLEKKVEKKTILTAYLNVINLGNGCIGVGAAADAYFDKKASELTLAECAAIAAITNNPTRYNPRTHPDENMRRRKIILTEMLSQGYIGEEEYARAVGEALTLCAEKKDASSMTSWYTEMVAADVLRDLQVRLGYSHERAALLLANGGLVIEAAMNEALQAALTEYYEQEENFPVGTSGHPQSSAIIIDPYSGDILAVSGAVGRKEAYYLQNYATATKRPAGSAIKPLGVYAPALKEGLITWGSIYEDSPTLEKNGRPWPKNADGLYRGRVTIRDAVAQSLNTVPVEIVRAIGLENSFDFLRNTLHMESLIPANQNSANDMTVSSVALGQQHGGVTVRELTAAYTIFTEGLYRPPVSYHRVLDAEGNVLLENKSVGERVLTKQEATLMTHLLETVTEDGTARGLKLKDESGIPVAGKTGTTQNNCDRWFVGYTPNLLCGIWMGYEYPVPLDGIDGNPCLTVFDEVMSACEEIYRGSRVDFDRDPSVIPVRVCPLTGEIATPECYDALIDKNLPQTGWFIEGTEPKDACRLHFGGWMESMPLETESETDEPSTQQEDTVESQPNEPWWFSRILPWP
ncbi:MAG: transglycosylase domain-containing protein [Clostridia bacterium]|nr:transglycosylase domain-containing protein [Clostridia bacterium]